MIGLLGSRPDYSEEDGLASCGAGTEDPAQKPMRPADFQCRYARAVRGDGRRRVQRLAGAHVTHAVHEDVVEPRGAVVGSNRLVADDALHDIGGTNVRPPIARRVHVLSAGGSFARQNRLRAHDAARGVSHASTTIADAPQPVTAPHENRYGLWRPGTLRTIRADAGHRDLL